MALQITILTPSHIFWEGEAISIALPTKMGQLLINEESSGSPLGEKNGSIDLKNQKNDKTDEIIVSLETRDIRNDKTEEIMTSLESCEIDDKKTNTIIVDDYRYEEKSTELSMGLSFMTINDKSIPFPFIIFGGYVFRKENVLIIVTSVVDVVDDGNLKETSLKVEKAISGLEKFIAIEFDNVTDITEIIKIRLELNYLRLRLEVLQIRGANNL